MEKGDFKSWRDSLEFYKEEYKNINLEELLDKMNMRWEDGEFEDIDAYNREVKKEIENLYGNHNKAEHIANGGRPKGRTKRTIKRYKKVYHTFETLRKKYTSRKKLELYELAASRDYDGQTYTRKTIKNIIEDKMYNLIPNK